MNIGESPSSKPTNNPFNLLHIKISHQDSVGSDQLAHCASENTNLPSVFMKPVSAVDDDWLSRNRAKYADTSPFCDDGSEQCELPCDACDMAMRSATPSAL